VFRQDRRRRPVVDADVLEERCVAGRLWMVVDHQVDPIDQAWVDGLACALPELPDEKRAGFIKAGLSSYDASVLVAEKEATAYRRPGAVGLLDDDDEEIGALPLDDDEDFEDDEWEEVDDEDEDWEDDDDEDDDDDDWEDDEEEAEEGGKDWE